MIEGIRVVVGVDGSASGLAALRRAAQEADRRGAVLVPVVARTADGRSGPPADAARAARRRLDAVVGQACGGYPHGILIRPLVVAAAEPGHALVAAADRPTDLLVLGAADGSRLRHALHGSVDRYCRAHAVCAVLVVRTSGREPVARDGAASPCPGRWNGRAAQAGAGRSRSSTRVSTKPRGMLAPVRAR
ncbi:universal stress protein [Kitasatospora sp. NPDC094015]|uniref:universal stress protein n=1 Tax=Kitasatospora sp. NPDC094015 TaxID=3155205 RepID=UPI0033200254